MLSGDFYKDDLASFPSDHAVLFVSLSVGILLVHRWFGTLALLWTVVVILFPRVVSGMNWPLDIVAGAAIGTVCTLALAHFLSRRSLWGLDELILWSFHKPATSGALMFVVVFEVCNSYYNLRSILWFAKDAAPLFLG